MTTRKSETSRTVPDAGKQRSPGIAGERAYLRFLVQSAEDLNSSLELEKVFRKVAERIRPLVDFHLFCVML